jgi:hypothetical protein
MIGLALAASVLSFAPIPADGNFADREWSVEGDLRFSCHSPTFPRDAFNIQLFGNKKANALVITRSRIVDGAIERTNRYLVNVRSEMQSVTERPRAIKAAFIGRDVNFIGARADAGEEEYRFSFVWEDHAIYSDIVEPPHLHVSGKDGVFDMRCHYDNSRNVETILE